MSVSKFFGFLTDGSIAELQAKLSRKTDTVMSEATKSAIRTNLGVPTAAEGLVPSQNLNDVDDKQVSRDNLELYTRGETNDRTMASRLANALVFETDDYLSLGDSDLLSFTDGVGNRAGAIVVAAVSDDLTAGDLFTKFGATNPAREYRFQFLSSKLRFSFEDGSGNVAYRETDAVVTGQNGKLTTWGMSFTAASANASAADDVSLYQNGVALASTATNNGSFGGMHNSTQAAGLSKVGSSGTSFKGSVFRVYVFDRALSAAEHAWIANHGLDRANRLGGAGNVYTGDSTDFASSLGNWIEAGTTSITVAQSGGVAQVTNTASASGSRGMKNTTTKFSPYVWYRLTFKCRASSGTGQLCRVRGDSVGAFRSIANVKNGADVSGFFQFTPTASQTTFSFDFIGEHTDTDSVFFDLSTNTGAGEVYEFDDVVLEQVGCVMELGPGGIRPNGNWVSAVNGLRGLATGVIPSARPTAGQFTEEIELAHGDISSSAATTELLKLPKGCRVVNVETIVTAAFDGSTTLNVGISGTASKYASAVDVASTARRFDSNSNASESDTAETSVYVQKNQSTTSGNAKIRVTYEVTAPSV